MSRIIIPLIFGIAGAVVLVSLGLWQVQRLACKEGALADINRKIAAAPVSLPVQPDPQVDRYLPVEVDGVLAGPELHVLVSRKQVGPGYRIIQPFIVQDRRIMVDRGFVKLTDKDASRAQIHVTLTGNLHWPDETDGYTPDPDLVKNIWFARDVEAMAQALNTEQILLIERHSSQSDPGVTPLPVDTKGIPNDHLQYAATWFSLAVIWLVMTGYYIKRMRQTAKGEGT